MTWYTGQHSAHTGREGQGSAETLCTVIVTPTKHKIYSVIVLFEIWTVTDKILCSLIKNVLGIYTVSVEIYRFQAGLIQNS